jgi:hypothetical protein
LTPPARATPKGHKSFIFQAAPHRTKISYLTISLSALVALVVPELCMACELQ